MFRSPAITRLARQTLTLGLAALMASCGGGGGDPVQCRVPERQAWLKNYFAGAYFWASVSPKPEPGAAYPTLQSYFDALLYAGTNPEFPQADKWSGFGTTEAFNSFFTSGQTLGYGLFVTGVEANKNAANPLYVRYVAPASPGLAAGVRRGDRIVSVNGAPVADLITADDYSAFSPAKAGDKLTVVLADAGGAQRTVTLTAAVYDLTPVDGATVLTSAGGRKVGYLMIKDMVDQVSSPLAAAFAQFQSAGVSDLVIDLRYNGGGFVRIGAEVASYVNRSIPTNATYVQLKYRADQASKNSTYVFSRPAKALNLSKVYVLAGPRTCSASEQVINGLAPFVTVVKVGATTCGKPWGFVPVDDSCGSTFSIVNFESLNSAGTGRYIDGLTPTCAVSEDWSKSLGDKTEPLLSAALTLADGGACPAAIGGVAMDRMVAPASSVPSLTTAPRRVFDGERPAMIP